MTGSQVSCVAYPLLVFSLGGDALQAGLVGAVAVIPYLLIGMPAGVLVDRWNRKHLMIGCDIGRLVVLAAVAIVGVFGHLTIAQLAVTVVIDTALYILFNAAQIAALPRIVDPDQVTTALAQDQAGLQLALLSGPLLGGYLFQAVSRVAPFLLDAASYGASALTLVFLRTPLQERSHAPAGQFLREMGEGTAWLWRHKLVRFLTLSTGGIFFVGNASYLMVIVAAHHQHASPMTIGIILGAGSMGGVAGSILANRLGRVLPFVVIVAGSVWLQALVLPLYAVASNAAVLAGITAIIALIEAATDPVRYGYQLSLIPGALRGRVITVSSSLVFIPMWLGSAAAGALLQSFGIGPTALTLAAVLASLAAALSLNSDIRQVGLPGGSI